MGGFIHLSISTVVIKMGADLFLWDDDFCVTFLSMTLK